MARTETTVVTYDTDLLNGLDEDGGKHEPWLVAVNRVTETRVRDGRGTNYRASEKKYERLAELTVEQAGDLIRSLANDIAFAATVGENLTLKEN